MSRPASRRDRYYSIPHPNGSDWLIPRGVHFCPTEAELVGHYLALKISGSDPSCEIINEMDVYSYNPDELPIDEFMHGTRKEAFFFTKIRSNSTRSSSKGFWKACDEEKQIVHNNEIIGYKKTLIFVWENGQKSDYGMQEYSLSSDDFNLANNIEHLVLCRVEIKNRTSTLTEEGLVPPESAVEHSDTNMEEETRPYNLQINASKINANQGSS